ncbi:MAG: hypothetical protein GVY29_07585 [Spirochaetes bacterium]|jgi:hypothetical protein|nr:hypothetical protein [Spirochaetota bacterium]
MSTSDSGSLKILSLVAELDPQPCIATLGRDRLEQGPDTGILDAPLNLSQRAGGQSRACPFDSPGASVTFDIERGMPRDLPRLVSTAASEKL